MHRTDSTTICSFLPLLAVLMLLAGPAHAQTQVFINEIHYDNAGTDTGEAVEIAGPAGADVTGWKIVRYNGSNGAVYASPSANPAGSDVLSGTIPDFGDGFGMVVVAYVTNGLQNGSPDGLALVDASNNVVQFLSYEGTFTAVGGPADGMQSLDIGVSQPGTGSVGHSLQLTGAGTTYEEFTWTTEGPNTFGSINTGQSFGSGDGDAAPTVIGTSPGDGASNVAVDADIEVAFSEPVDVTVDAFEITCTLSGMHSVVVGGGPSTYTLDPDVDFDAGETCTVTVFATEVTDQDDNDPPDQMGGDFQFSFTISAGPSLLVINEIDYDQPGTDEAEFIELYNGGETAVNLDGFSVQLVNGSGGAVYRTIDLPNVELAAGDYFVICGNPATVINCDFDAGPETNLIQNGAPDAVALFQGSTLIDAVSYEGDVPGFTEGSGAGLVDSGSGFAGISRFPDGTDTDQNNVDLSLRCISPGRTNLVESSNCADPSAVLRVVINEVDSDTPGTDVAEFVELYGDPNIALDGLVVVFYNGNGDVSYEAFDLDGFTTNANGFFLMGNSGVTPAPALVFANNRLQNGPDAVALYRGDATDFANGTAVTTEDLLDAIVYGTDDPDATGLLVLLNPGQPQVNESSHGNPTGHSNQRLPNGEGGQRNTDSYAQIPPTPGAVNAGPPEVAEIFEIQGSGPASPLEGQHVTTGNNVVTALAPDGFFIQTPQDRSDGDPHTSDGIFVFTGSAPTVSVGDLVEVTGQVVEFFGFTEIAGNPEVTVIGSGVVPDAVVFNATTPSLDPSTPSCGINNFECFEGMLVNVSGGTVGAGNQRFGTDPIAEVFFAAGGARAMREPGIQHPGLSGLPVWDGNPELFELDPDKLGLPNEIISGGSTFSATGVIGFEFGDFELWPFELTIDAAPMPNPVRVPAAGEATVGSLNLFRLFDDVDDPGSEDNGEVVSTAEYQRRLAKFSLYIRNVLRAPDVLAVQEVEKLSVLEALAAKIASDDPAISYDAYLVEGNDVGGIDVGFLVRSIRYEVDAVTQLAAEDTFTNPMNGNDDLLHDRPPLLLEGAFLNAGARIREVAVLAVHNRSLSGIEGAQGQRVRAKRLAQAESLAEIAQDFQTNRPDVGLVITGDFNAYEFSDGYVDVVGRIRGDFDGSQDQVTGSGDLVDPNLTNHVLSLPVEERYSFIFGGTAQVLDHALTTTSLDAAVTGFAYGRGNADAAAFFLDDGNTPLRSSDHDGLVLYLDVTPPVITLNEQAELWPPNHKYHTFSVSELVADLAEASLSDVYIKSVSSDEAEDAPDSGDTTEDVVIDNCQTVRLRAERTGGGNGRVYTVTLAAVDAAGNEGSADFHVHVPVSLSGNAIGDDPAFTVQSGCSAPAPDLAKAAIFRSEYEMSEALEFEAADPPAEFQLRPNYPNPFNPVTSLRFDMPEDGAVTLVIFNMLGQEVARLVDEQRSAGRHQVAFDASRLSSGVYVSVLEVGGRKFTRTMQLIK